MIRTVIEEGVAQVTIDRPPVNAFSSGLWEALIDQFAKIAEDSEVAVVILTAAGSRAFSAGADIKETAGLTTGGREERAELVGRGLRSIHTFPLPIICAINGPASGGGVNVATLCDYRIASEDAHFSLPEILHGATAGGGAFLRRIGVSAGSTRALLFGANRITATRAKDIHLVDEVVPTGTQMERARQIAAEFALHGRAALMRMKAAIVASELDLDLFAAYTRAQEAHASTTSQAGSEAL